MLSNNWVFVFLLAFVATTALLVSHIITSREQYNQSLDVRLKWLKEQAQHTLNALATLKELNCRGDIIDKINQHALALIEEIAVLAPESDLMTEISRVKDTTDRTRAKPDAFTNDRSIRKAQIYIKFAEKLIMDMAEKRTMTLQLAQTYQNELYWLNICMVADAQLHQGKELMHQGEKISALTYFKHAKAMLVRAGVSAQLKQLRLQQVQNLIDQLQPKKMHGPGVLNSSMDTLDNY